jgi:hypothetical protein
MFEMSRDTSVLECKLAENARRQSATVNRLGPDGTPLPLFYTEAGNPSGAATAAMGPQGKDT